MNVIVNPASMAKVWKLIIEEMAYQAEHAHTHTLTKLRKAELEILRTIYQKKRLVIGEKITLEFEAIQFVALVNLFKKSRSRPSNTFKKSQLSDTYEVTTTSELYGAALDYLAVHFLANKLL